MMFRVLGASDACFRKNVVPARRPGRLKLRQFSLAIRRADDNLAPAREPEPLPQVGLDLAHVVEQRPSVRGRRAEPRGGESLPSAQGIVRESAFSSCVVLPTCQRM